MTASLPDRPDGLTTVLFDCDGVLVDSEVVGLEESARFLREHGFDWQPQDLIRRFTGMRQDRFAAALTEAYAEVLGRAPDAGEREALMDGLIDARRRQRDTMQLVPGAAASVEAARAAGLAVAVASSSATMYLHDKIDRFGLRPLFGDAVFSADLVANGKPAPDIFLHAAEAMGAAPNACLVVEDSAHGVRAGRAAGMTVWGFTGGGHCLDDHAEALRLAEADAVLPDHEALAPALRALA